MTKVTFGLFVAAVAVFATSIVNGEEPSVGNIDNATLAALGFADLQVMSDQEGMQVRGQGFKSSYRGMKSPEHHGKYKQVNYGKSKYGHHKKSKHGDYGKSKYCDYGKSKHGYGKPKHVSYGKGNYGKSHNYGSKGHGYTPWSSVAKYHGGGGWKSIR